MSHSPRTGDTKLLIVFGPVIRLPCASTNASCRLPRTSSKIGRTPSLPGAPGPKCIAPPRPPIVCRPRPRCLGWNRGAPNPVCTAHVPFSNLASARMVGPKEVVVVFGGSPAIRPGRRQGLRRRKRRSQQMRWCEQTCNECLCEQKMAFQQARAHTSSLQS